MTRTKPDLRALPIAALALLLASHMPAPAPAQEDAAEEVEEAFDVNMIQISEQQISSWVFGDRGIVFANERILRPSHVVIGEGLQLQLDLVEAAVPLSEPQRRKLELAGRGDVDRFMDRYEAFIRECPAGSVPQDKYVELHQKAQPLASRYRAGLYGAGSLFDKVLRSALGAEQLARLETLRAERGRKRYEALVKATVVMIEQKVPLTADQRKRLTEITLRDTVPPEGEIDGSYKYYLVLLKMSEIPEDRLKPIFADDEWEAVQVLLQQGRVARGVLRRAAEEEADE